MRPLKPVIGLIGAIGAGKSTVANALAGLGGFVVDADKFGHEVLDEPAVRDQLVERWGTDLLRPDGSVNRRTLGAIVFADPAERKVLEGIVFPRIHEREADSFALADADPAARFIVLDAAVLLEAGRREVCKKLLFVDAPREERLKRLIARSGWTDEELTRREAAQLPLAEKRRLADAVIVNAGDAGELHAATVEVLHRWRLLAPPAP